MGGLLLGKRAGGRRREQILDTMPGPGRAFTSDILQHAGHGVHAGSSYRTSISRAVAESGRYGVGVAGFEQLLEQLDLSHARSRLIVIDEIGKMECLSRQFINEITTLLNGRRNHCSERRWIQAGESSIGLPPYHGHKRQSRPPAGRAGKRIRGDAAKAPFSIPHVALRRALRAFNFLGHRGHDLFSY